MFVIEDQELLFAMSYKSNRNWTLPQVIGGFNVTLCPDCDLFATYVTGTTGGSSGGTITITPFNAVGTILYILNDTLVQSSNTFTGLTAGTYTIKVIDQGAPECFVEETVVVGSS
jgi:hypothetical protein